MVSPKMVPTTCSRRRSRRQRPFPWAQRPKGRRGRDRICGCARCRSQARHAAVGVGDHLHGFLCSAQEEERGCLADLRRACNDRGAPIRCRPTRSVRSGRAFLNQDGAGSSGRLGAVYPALTQQMAISCGVMGALFSWFMSFRPPWKLPALSRTGSRHPRSVRRPGHQRQEPRPGRRYGCFRSSHAFPRGSC